MRKKLITTILLAGLVLILAACSTNVNPTSTRPSGTLSAPGGVPTTAPATVEPTLTPSASDTSAPTPTATQVTIHHRHLLSERPGRHLSCSGKPANQPASSGNWPRRWKRICSCPVTYQCPKDLLGLERLHHSERRFVYATSRLQLNL